MNAAEICRQAADLVSGDRKDTHGDTTRNHQNIARLWSAYLDVPVTPDQVAMMMVLLKVARTKSGAFNIDDFRDMAGYAGCAGEIRGKMEG
ncbi:MAG: hypothetical protein JNL61_11380 [Rhizobiaceae bacterium]|nr:hypothetical protein [Rhizobiaceae bacterium]